MRLRGFRFAAALALLLSTPTVAFTDSLPIIDAHNQSDQNISYAEVLRLMDAAGVSRVILAQRGRMQPASLLEFAAKHPSRITAAVRTKGQNVQQVRKQADSGGYGAMAEVLMWHREKSRQTVTTKSGETTAPP